MFFKLIKQRFVYWWTLTVAWLPRKERLSLVSPNWRFASGRYLAGWSIRWFWKSLAFQTARKRWCRLSSQRLVRMRRRRTLGLSRRCCGRLSERTWWSCARASHRVAESLKCSLLYAGSFWCILICPYILLFDFIVASLWTRIWTYREMMNAEKILHQSDLEPSGYLTRSIRYFIRLLSDLIPYSGTDFDNCWRETEMLLFRLA